MEVTSESATTRARRCTASDSKSDASTVRPSSRPENEPERQRHADLPENRAEGLCPSQPASRHAAHYDGRGLRTHVAAHADDDGNERKKEDHVRLSLVGADKPGPPGCRPPKPRTARAASARRYATEVLSEPPLRPSPTPAMRRMSSVSSSRMMSITSSTVMMPTSLLPWSTTGSAR